MTVIFKTRSQAEWIDLFQSTDACCEPVLSLKEAMDSDLAQDRHFITTDEKGIPALNCPIKSVGEAVGKPGKAPVLGGHNPSILKPVGDL